MPRKTLYSLDPSPKSVTLPTQLSVVAEMLKSDDLQVIDQAVEAWAAFAETKPEAADKLIATVGVSAAGKWQPGARFTRKDPDKQKVLSYALLGLLSLSPAGTRGAFLREHIKKLEIIMPDVPLLQGFTGLQILYLRIEPQERPPVRGALDWSSRFSALPSLRELKLIIPGKRYSPGSLQVFASSLLERVEAYDNHLLSIEGIDRSGKLHTLKINGGFDKKSIALDLSPLASSRDSLNNIELFGCLVADLSPLSALRDLREIKLTNTMVSSIKELPVITGKRLELPLTITSLEGIEKQVNIQELKIHGNVEDSLHLISSLSNLESLYLGFETKGLPDLAGLTGLQRLRISNQTLEALPKQWPPAIKEIDIEHCYKINSLGVLPQSLEGLLDLSQFSRLETLEGIEACARLNEVRVPQKCKDISAAAALPDTWIRMIIKGGKSSAELLARWIEQLAEAPSCKIRLDFSNHNGSRKLEDLNGLAAITGLKALDLSTVDKLGDPNGILRMDNLEYLEVQPRSDLSKRFGAVTFSGEESIAALKLKLFAMG